MAETDVTEDSAVSHEDQLRQQLLRRIGVAGLSIIGLVAALAIFDAVYVPESQTAVLVAEPPPVAPAAPLPVSPEPPPAEEKVAEAPPAEPAVIEEKKEEAPKAAENKVAETKSAETKPTVAAAPERTSLPSAPPLRERPLTKSAVAQPASIKSATHEPAAPPPAKALQQAQQRPTPTRPLTQMEESNRRYLVQMGVFNNVANAEELRSKLEKAGIPSQIEARVQVGPFNNKLEAENAQKKLAELGLQGLLVSARK